MKATTVLDGLRIAAENIHSKKVKDAESHLIILDYERMRVRTQSFKKAEMTSALKLYSDFEKDPNVDAVLVSASSLISLKRAYPNYFLDAREFTNLIKDMCRSKNT